MKIMTKNNNKGQGMVSSVGALISLGFMIVIALVIIGNLEESTLGDCSVAMTNVVNTTDSDNVSAFFHGFILANVIEGSDALGNVTISAENMTDGSCQVLVGNTGTWTSLGYLDNTTADDVFQFTTVQIGPAMNLNYTDCVSNNITLANISYNALASCDYTYDAYTALTKTTSMTYTGMNIVPVAIVIFAAVTVLGTLYLLVSKT